MLKRFYYLIILVCFIVSPSAHANSGSIQTLTGVVTGTSGSQIFFRAGSAALYAAEVGNATLVRKYGAPMKMEEVLVGDKVETKGFVWSDNSISATYFRDLSLYAHNSSFSGKVSAINPQTGSFTLQSKQYGPQNINTGPLTIFKKNGQTSSFSQIELGINETVKGVWERSYENVLASNVSGIARLISLQITGILSVKNGNSLTILADNVIYGVDAGSAKIQNKNNKPVSISNYNLGDTIKVEGKHLSEGVAIVASLIKDLSISN